MTLPPVGKLRILLYPDSILKRKCSAVEAFGPGLAAVAQRMLELMHEAKGIGLAGPQVGVPIRLFVCNVTADPTNDQIFVNPRFIELSGAAEGEEGCLSIPGVTVTMRRASRAIIEAFDVDGRLFQLGGEDLQARVWQHEADHLDGRLITDNMSPSDEIANRRALRQLKQDYAASCRV